MRLTPIAPTTAANNATNANVAASLVWSSASDPACHTMSTTIGSPTNASTPNNRVRSAPLTNTVSGRLAVAEARRVLDVHLMPVTAHATPRHVGVLDLERDRRRRAARDAERGAVREQPVPDRDAGRRDVAELLVVLQIPLDAEPPRGGRIAGPPSSGRSGASAATARTPSHATSATKNQSSSTEAAAVLVGLLDVGNHETRGEQQQHHRRQAGRSRSSRRESIGRAGARATWHRPSRRLANRSRQPVACDSSSSIASSGAEPPVAR